jgi:8-oxo-dGTP diphosphatase
VNPPKIHGVVAAILIKNKTFLGVKRKLSMSTNPGLWEFPGGKIEFNETPQQALLRVVKEELSIHVNELEEFFNIPIIVQAQTVMLYYFIVKRWTGNIDLIDHDIGLWFDYKKFKNSTWLSGDEECLQRLKKENRIK